MPTFTKLINTVNAHRKSSTAARSLRTRRIPPPPRQLNALGLSPSINGTGCPSALVAVTKISVRSSATCKDAVPTVQEGLAPTLVRVGTWRGTPWVCGRSAAGTRR